MANLVKKDKQLNKYSYYEANLVRNAIHTPLTENIQSDICIIGAGFAGLSAAIELKQMGYDVVVLESIQCGFGASGRNGGQVIVGYAADDQLIKKFGIEQAKQFWDISVEGVALLKQRIQKYNIECDFEPGFLAVSTNKKKAKELFESAELKLSKFNYPHQKIIPKQAISNYINSDIYHNAVYDDFSGHLNPLKYALGLADIAKSLGVRIYENTPAVSIQGDSTLIIKTPLANCQSKYCLIAGNVYTNEYGKLLPKKIEKQIMPVGTYITVTEPLDKAFADSLIPSKAAVCDTDIQLDYFRFTPDNRLLFGGDVALGSNVPENYIERVKSRMTRVFPSVKDIKIDYTWGGHVDVTMNQLPDFGKIQNNIFYLQGFSGHGVALTGIAGKLVAHAIDGEAKGFDLYGKIKHNRFIGPEFLRTPTLLIGLWYHTLLDKIL
ncbi:NAD(P)/FAD-dependent oxidoreductase [Thorsellia anophelis]|uniref:Gamma-glutamylputrescine oxidase n=1 Tax=Thorsellia anophelis DSM 18579 TaxID=1123402 RepID=A0A1I0DY16_9GAMM|nr:FAD-binding oxidoreductase [Thorsellia anophelis]SET36774.1 gamma-glutamylputrescine oxidase [Thorsellia anophelis DSM 18579]